MHHHRRQAFTVTEMLVAVMIIGVLISLLVPAISSFRASSKTAQCALNMQRLGQAILAYAQDNDGNLPPVKIDAGVVGYPQGEFWANLLVRAQYIAAPNALQDAASLKSMLRCPDGESDPFNDEKDPWPQGGDSRRDPRNFRGTSPRPSAGLAVRTWYQLNAAPVKIKPHPDYDAPFVAIRLRPGESGVPADPAYKRTIGQIRKSAEVVMATEGVVWNQGLTKPDPGGGPAVIAARHGKPTRDGKDAQTNILFFDGHVARFDTLMFAAAPNMHFRTGTIFHLADQE